MSYAPAYGTSRSPSGLACLAYGLGVLVRCGVRAVTYPYRALTDAVRSTKRSGRRRSDGVDPGPEYEAARIAAHEGFEALARALGDPDPSKRILALDVVCELSGKRAATLLTGVLHDPDPEVRAAAADAAAQLQASGTVFSLILTLDDPFQDVQRAAAQAIESITGERIELNEDESDAQRQRLIEELKEWWKEQRFAELATATRLMDPSR